MQQEKERQERNRAFQRRVDQIVAYARLTIQDEEERNEYIMEEIYFLQRHEHEDDYVMGYGYDYAPSLYGSKKKKRGIRDV